MDLWSRQKPFGFRQFWREAHRGGHTLTPENIAKFWISVGRPLVPPDHEIYQDRSWRISFVSRPQRVEQEDPKKQEE